MVVLKLLVILVVTTYCFGANSIPQTEKIEKSKGVLLNFKPQKTPMKGLVVTGFEFLEKFPNKRIKQSFKVPRGTKVHRDLWYLGSKTPIGEILLADFQPSKTILKNVIVDINYHVSSYDQSGMTVIGLNTENEELQEETLSPILEPSLYCRKLIYLGDVDEIRIKAFVKSETEFVVIHDLNISVGTDTYDNEEETKCNVKQTEKI